ncbi:spore coat protein [Paenibacillus sambharensis]|uniref:Spore coat protein n=1 Tax=Paenibacillus sambharensis TaxID=1803190 RepID=A0A2W1LRZ1_9BACL|nr:spore coat protein [Paenibacillus sambharensis]PZD97545.1 spore coat protein [Paenibacillus sambharensis]
MNTLIERLAGMADLKDDVIAMEMLTAVKSGVRNYAMAVTETITPEIRDTLTEHLEELITMHERVTTYMINKGLYHPWNVQEQIQVDRKHIAAALKLAKI